MSPYSKYSYTIIYLKKTSKVYWQLFRLMRYLKTRLGWAPCLVLGCGGHGRLGLDPMLHAWISTVISVYTGRYEVAVASDVPELRVFAS